MPEGGEAERRGVTVTTLRAPLAGWAMPLAEVPDPVFAEGMMGDGIAIDPTGDTLHAPCDGTVLTIHEARHAITIATDTGAELLIHIGIDSVAMAGAGFAPLVTPGARVTTGMPLIRFDLDRLVTSASAAVTPLIVTGDGVRIDWRHAGGVVAMGDDLLRVDDVADDNAAERDAGPTIAREVTVGLPHGLHARPAARIVAALRPIDATATLSHGDKHCPATSAIGMLGLGLSHGVAVKVTAQGPQAQAAIDTVARMLTRQDEEVPTPPAPAASPLTVASGALPDGALAGVAAAPGIAIGPAHRLRRARPAPPEHASDIASERVSLAKAMAAIGAELDGDAATTGAQAGVFAAHRAILDDPALCQAATDRIDAGAHAAAAILAAAEAQAAPLRASGDARIAERADDIIDVAERVAHAILGTRGDAVSVPVGAVLIAADLLPSHFTRLDPAMIAGIALMRGGPTAHVAILSASAGVPMVVALGDGLDRIVDGMPMLIDGTAGHVVPDPAPAVRADAEARIARLAEAERQARTIGTAAVTTRDGTPIAVQVNCGSAADATAGMAAGADGCGLLRTEFLFLDRTAAPDRDEQAAAYRAVLSGLPDRPVTIRLLDIGGDKPAPYLSLPDEENPALGLRGVRVALARREILTEQLAAILSLDDPEARIMVPMVASVAELTAVRAAIDALSDGRQVKLGAMIETPAAAIGADLIAREADFLSIGSNDLTQYALAADRGNAAVAAMLDGLHPAVLRLIAETCDRAGSVPVSVCGGLAADPLAVPILIGLGVRTLSVPSARVPATKALVTTLTRAHAERHARATLDCGGAAEVRALARAFAEEIGA